MELDDLRGLIYSIGSDRGPAQNRTFIYDLNSIPGNIKIRIRETEEGNDDKKLTLFKPGLAYTSDVIILDTDTVRDARLKLRVAITEFRTHF